MLVKCISVLPTLNLMNKRLQLCKKKENASVNKSDPVLYYYKCFCVEVNQREKRKIARLV